MPKIPCGEAVSPIYPASGSVISADSRQLPSSISTISGYWRAARGVYSTVSRRIPDRTASVQSRAPSSAIRPLVRRYRASASNRRTSLTKRLSRLVICML